MAEDTGLGQGNLSDTSETPGIAEPFAGAMSELADFGQKTAAAQEEAGKPAMEANYDAISGQWELKNVPANSVQALLNSQRQLQQIQASFNSEALRLQQRENQLRSNPILNVLANVSAGLAQDPKMPGWVQGLGRANAALNPTPDAIAARRMGILQTLASLQGKSATIGSQLETARHHGALEKIAEENAGTRKVNAATRQEAVDQTGQHLDDIAFNKQVKNVQMFKPGLSPEQLGDAVRGWNEMSDEQRSQLYQAYTGHAAKETQAEADRQERLRQGQEKVETGQRRAGVAESAESRKAATAAAPPVKDVQDKLSRAEAAARGALAQAERDEAAGRTAAAVQMRAKAKVIRENAKRIEKAATPPAGKTFVDPLTGKTYAR